MKASILLLGLFFSISAFACPAGTHVAQSNGGSCTGATAPSGAHCSCRCDDDSSNATVAYSGCNGASDVEWIGSSSSGCPSAPTCPAGTHLVTGTCSGGTIDGGTGVPMESSLFDFLIPRTYASYNQSGSGPCCPTYSCVSNSPSSSGGTSSTGGTSSSACTSGSVSCAAQISAIGCQ